MKATCKVKGSLDVRENRSLHVKNAQNFELIVKRNWMGLLLELFLHITLE